MTQQPQQQTTLDPTKPIEALAGIQAVLFSANCHLDGASFSWLQQACHTLRDAIARAEMATAHQEQREHRGELRPVVHNKEKE